jgi:hypothetical protein
MFGLDRPGRAETGYSMTSSARARIAGDDHIDTALRKLAHCRDQAFYVIASEEVDRRLRPST